MYSGHPFISAHVYPPSLFVPGLTWKEDRFSIQVNPSLKYLIKEVQHIKLFYEHIFRMYNCL